MLARFNSRAAMVASRSLNPSQPNLPLKASSLSRMLLSTNQSRIVDVSHENELRRGLTTSGERQDVEEKNKPISQELKEGARNVKEEAKAGMDRMAGRIDSSANIASDSMQEMADRTHESLDRISKSMDDATHGIPSKLDALSNRSKDDLEDMENSLLDREKSRRLNLGPMDDPAQEIKRDMRRVGNVNRVAGDLSMENQRFKENPETVEESLGRESMDPDAAKSYDIANKMEKEAQQLYGSQEEQSYHDIPGSKNPYGKNLRGTEDNFNDDPAISFGDIKDKAREMKNKFTGNDNKLTAEDSDNLMDSMKQSMMNTGRGIKETVKGMTEAAKETVQNTTAKTKEFLTGERESEKPDETKSEVRTARKTYPDNKGPSQPQSSDQSTKRP